MKIRRMFEDCGLTYHYLIETVDGTFKSFYCSPYRKIEEKDLIPLKCYIAKGNRAKEVPDYLLRFYGLEKV